MPRHVNSGWDFGAGELFAPSEFRKVVTVSELTSQVRRTLEAPFRSIWVSGEVSNLRLQPSGHAYFTLKDAGSQLSAVLFRGEAAATRAHLKDGTKVVLGGDLTVYEPRGQYQLRVTAVELQGVGALQAAFERLKQRLQAEGLFSPDRKRPIPRFPSRIGIVTSPSGAAIRDVLHVVGRRNPSLELVLWPSRVQGEGAAAEIAAGIHSLNQWSAGGEEATRLDLILVTRGGGSLEDLWAFNEEVVARAIAASSLPVVSAVGHEIDFTISDFVADLRAATPSAAAELVTEDMFAARQRIPAVLGKLEALARRGLRFHQDRLKQISRAVARNHPQRVLEERSQRLDDLLVTLQRAGGLQLERAGDRMEAAEARWRRADPQRRLQLWRERIQALSARLAATGLAGLERKRFRMEKAVARAELLSPRKVLERGYSITLDAGTGAVVRGAGDARPGQKLRTILAVGEIASRVEP